MSLIATNRKPRRLGPGSKAAAVSLLFHLGLLFLLSGVVVTQQIYHFVRNKQMVPAVNLQLTREMEVRTQTRSQISPLPEPAPQSKNEAPPQPVEALSPEPTPAAPQAQVAMAPVAPEVPELVLPPPPSVAALQLAPIQPVLTLPEVGAPAPVQKLDPQTLGEAAPDAVHAQTAAANELIGGQALGTEAAPPASASLIGPGVLNGVLAAGGGADKGPFQNGGGGAGGGNGSGPGNQPAVLPPLAKPVSETPPDHPFAQRTFENRQPLLLQNGGSKETEDAVSKALAYLARNQEPDGRWTLVKDDHGPGDRPLNSHDTAYTGLATLSFLAANYTPLTPGLYQETVRKGVEYLVFHQKPDGDLRLGGNMYDHAIATLALCEAAAMTGDQRYRQAAQAGASFIVSAQNSSDGGWRYDPGEAGDTSVLGWQVLALHSAERTGFMVPEMTRRGALGFLESVGSGRQKIITGYVDLKPSVVMTAESVFARNLLGQPATDAQVQAAEAYMKTQMPPDGRPNYYYWYYGSLALMPRHDDVWRDWNQQLTTRLLKLQEQNGALAGSFDMDSEWGPRAGRIYTTAIATLTLEVYYRY